MSVKITTIRLPEEVHRAVKRIAFENEISINAWITLAAQEKLERDKETEHE